MQSKGLAAQWEIGCGEFENVCRHNSDTSIPDTGQGYRSSLQSRIVIGSSCGSCFSDSHTVGLLAQWTLSPRKQPCAGGHAANATGAGALMGHRHSRNAAMQQNGPARGRQRCFIEQNVSAAPVSCTALALASFKLGFRNKSIDINLTRNAFSSSQYHSCMMLSRM